MSKFCKSCGASLSDEATFCTGCGATQDASAPATTQTPVAPAFVQPQTAPKSGSGMVGIVVVGVIALFVIILLASIFGGSYKTPIKNMYKGMEKGNWNTFSSCMTKEQKNLTEDSFDKMDVKNGKEYMEKYMTASLEKKFGKNINISLKFKSKKNVSKDDIKDLEDTYNEIYDKEVNISKAYEVKVEATIKGKDDKDTSTSTITVGKIGLKWYVLN